MIDEKGNYKARYTVSYYGHRTAWEGWLYGAKKVPWELMEQMTDQEIKELYDCDNDFYFDWGVMYFATKYCMQLPEVDK